MKKLIFILTILSCTLLMAEIPDNAGTCSFAFLKSIQSPRSEAMGAAFIALPAENPHILDNPALIAFNNRSAGATYRNNWGFGNTGNVWYVQPIGEESDFGKKYGVGGYVHYISYGESDKRSETGALLGTFTPSDMVISAGSGIRVNKNFSAGAMVKVVNERADDLSASGVALDLGLLYRFTKQRAQIGLVAQNLGTQMSSFGDDTYPLPMLIGVGASSRIPGLPFLTSLQGDYYKDDGLVFSAGLELLSFDPFFLRVGYRATAKVESDLADNENLRGLSAGFGYTHSKFRLDYALKHYGVLGMAHTVAFSMNF